MKHVVITGSTKGIGYGMAHHFLKAGCKVTISSSRLLHLEHALETFYSSFSEAQVFGVKADVTRRRDIENLCNKAVSEMGDIDIWINNAGINQPLEFFHDIPEEELDRLIAINISGVIHGSQVAMQRMLKQGFGQIFNMEGLGSNNMIFPKSIVYGTSKAALTYFTKGLAKEAKNTGIKVGRLSPGMVVTELLLGMNRENSDKSFSNIMNVLADDVNTVTPFLVKKILSNKKNNAHIQWLTNRKASFRFMTAMFRKNRFQV